MKQSMIKKKKSRVKNVLGNIKMTTETKHSKHLVVELEDKSWQTTFREQDKNWRHGGSDVREDGAVRSARNPSLSRQLYLQIRSDQISRSFVSNSLRPQESQHARPPCPSPTPGVHPDSRPSSQWCHPAISSSVVPFSSCPQSLPASVFSSESTLHMRWPKY